MKMSAHPLDVALCDESLNVMGLERWRARLLRRFRLELCDRRALLRPIFLRFVLLNRQVFLSKVLALHHVRQLAEPEKYPCKENRSGHDDDESVCEWR